MKYQQRCAILLKTNWWLAYQATYPLGQIIVDADQIAVRIPAIKTSLIKRSEIKELLRLKGASGRLRWLFMPGIRIVHTNKAEPSLIQCRVPDFEKLRVGLSGLGYEIKEEAV